MSTNKLTEMTVTYGENYTDLVHAGEGVTIENGVISASGGSGGGMVVPNYTFDENHNVVCNMTFNEIHTAFLNGQCYYATLTRETPGGTIVQALPLSNSTDSLVVFMMLIANGSEETISELVVNGIAHSSNDSASFIAMAKEF